MAEKKAISIELMFANKEFKIRIMRSRYQSNNALNFEKNRYLQKNYKISINLKIFIEERKGSYHFGKRTGIDAELSQGR